jgi:hypothetical protein
MRFVFASRHAFLGCIFWIYMQFRKFTHAQIELVESRFSLLMANIEQLRAVTNYSAEYARTWWWPFAGSTIAGITLVYSEDFTAQMLLAAGRGPARVTTCRSALEHIRVWEDEGRQLFTRTVSLLRQGELPALRVVDPEAFDVVLSALQDEECDAKYATPAPVRPRLLDTLQSLGWCNVDAANRADSALALVKRCAGTLRELECRLYDIDDNWSEALARCTRLESLTFVDTFPPASWIGLSQLHTLLGVELSTVSVAAIAAALPRLHTLGLSTRRGPSATAASVAGFFDTLLSRLRVFRFSGDWPVEVGLPKTPAQALPLLEELVWEVDNDDLDIADRFAGAQPVMLFAPCATVVKYAAAAAGRAGGCGPLFRVRDLHFYDMAPQASDVAAVLRAAPELRTLDVGTLGYLLAWCSDPSFAGLVHWNLRSLQFQHSVLGAPKIQQLIAAQYDELQVHHLPRLRPFVPA